MTDEIDTPHSGGRPSAYDDSYPDLAYKLCLLMGATDKDLADFFEVCETTINNWKLAHPEFKASLQNGKKRADMHIAQKLFNRAEGAEWIEQSAFKVKRDIYDDAGKKIATQEEIVTVDLQKAAPPDTKAIIYWLNNCDPARWRDKQDHELTGKDGAALTNEITVTVVKPRPQEG